MSFPTAISSSQQYPFSQGIRASPAFQPVATAATGPAPPPQGFPQPGDVRLPGFPRGTIPRGGAQTQTDNFAGIQFTPSTPYTRASSESVTQALARPQGAPFTRPQTPFYSTRERFNPPVVQFAPTPVNTNATATPPPYRISSTARPVSSSFRSQVNAEQDEAEHLRQTYGISPLDQLAASLDTRLPRAQPLVPVPVPADARDAGTNQQCPVPAVAARRTIADVVALSPPPAQIIPPQWYELRILGVPYTVVRFVGFSESPWLIERLDERRESFGETWNADPIEIDVPECGGSAGSCDQGGEVRRLRYADALFAAFAYQVDAFAALDAEQLVCLLQTGTEYALPLDAKALVFRLLATVDPREPSTYSTFIAVLGQYAQFLSGGSPAKSLPYARILDAAQAATSRVMPVMGFSRVAEALVLSPSPADAPFWRGDLMDVLGASVSATKGLGTEAVTGALVHVLMEPALAAAGTSSEFPEQTVLDAQGESQVREAIEDAAEYLADLRVKQDGQVADRGVAERLFAWVRAVSPLDVEIARRGAACSRRYPALVLTANADACGGSVLYFGDRKTCLRADARTGAVIESVTVDPVSGVLSLFDDWESVTIRPKNAAQAQQLAQHFAPSAALRAALSPVADEAPYAFRIDRSRIISALLEDPTLFLQFRNLGLLQGVPSVRS